MAQSRAGGSTRSWIGRAVVLGLGSVLAMGGLTWASPPASATSSWTAVQTGDWDDPATWGGEVPSFPAATPSFTAQIPSGITVTVPTGAEVIGAFNVHGRIVNYGNLFVRGTVRIGEVFNGEGGQLWVLSGGELADGSGLTNGGRMVNSGGELRLSDDVYNYGTIYNDGLAKVYGYTHVDNYGTITNVGELDVDPPIANEDGIYNRIGGLIANDDQFAIMDIGGYVVNDTTFNIPAPGTTPPTFVNKGYVRIEHDGDRLGLLWQRGPGPALVDNYGTLQVDSGLDNGTGADNVIRNRADAFLNIGVSDFGGVGVDAGRIVNDAGGSITIGAKGTLDNSAVVDNDGLIDNGNKFLNTTGEVRVRCNGSITGNAVTGNAPRDWCDSTPPTLTVPGPTTVEATGPTGAVVTYTASATDNKDPAPSVVCQEPSGSTFGFGTQTVYCTALDYVGNRTDQQFDVTVVDTTAPVITVLGTSPLVVVQNNAYTDAGATATDAVAGNLTSSITTTNPVNTAVPGTYTVSYAVTDGWHNTGHASRTVTVVKPGTAVTALSSYVSALPIAQSTKDGLTRPLDRAAVPLNDSKASNDSTACPLLKLFADTVVRDQQKSLLTAGQASTLLAHNREIMTGVRC